MRLKPAILAIAAVLAMALPASAACYADYRAQQSNPVRFHYGVAQIPDNACGNAAAAAQALQGRLASDGWTLVNVLSTFGDEGLSSRRANAGSFYLRY